MRRKQADPPSANQLLTGAFSPLFFYFHAKREVFSIAEAFTPITTQEAFDAAVAERLAPYADYDTLKSQNATYAQQIKDYEISALRGRIAHEEGIPYELAQRLTGSTEAEIRKDAQSFAKMLKPQTPAAPLRSDPDDRAGGKKTALRTLADQLMNK